MPYALWLCLHQAKLAFHRVTVQVDLPDVTRTSFGIAHPEPILWRQAAHSNLANLQVMVHAVGCLAGLLKRIRFRKQGMNGTLTDETVGFPRFSIIGEV